jgi:hypothetical protein
MDDNVMRTYCSKAETPVEIVQFDQGELRGYYITVGLLMSLLCLLQVRIVGCVHFFFSKDTGSRTALLRML